MRALPLHTAWRQWACSLGLGLAGLLLAGSALAHSSSNSYLTLSAPDQKLTLRADINLRDIDLIFDLDANRDGQVTWGETQGRSAELNAWLGQGMGREAAPEACRYQTWQASVASKLLYGGCLQAVEPGSCGCSIELYLHSLCLLQSTHYCEQAAAIYAKAGMAELAETTLDE